MSFSREIIQWYAIHQRDLPWRHSNDAYVIWLSEIILQQTRVEQGLPYFYKFLEAFPTVQHFAAAEEMQVLKLWQGLGYYSRGRNMLHTAKAIIKDHKGVFPKQYQDLIKLKGIGPYTAAAIASFSANSVHAVVDGNVSRVLSRYWGVQEAINTPAGQKLFYKLANELIDQQHPGLYNQAIMEFGALQCVPKSPNCGICPLAHTCYALKEDKVASLPIKIKAKKKKVRYMQYFVLIEDGHILLKKRTSRDVWQNLYDFPALESSTFISKEEPELNNYIKKLYGNEVIIKPLAQSKQTLSHQIIEAQFFGIMNYISNFNIEIDCIWVNLDHLTAYPHPKLIDDFLQSLSTNLFKTTQN